MWTSNHWKASSGYAQQSADIRRKLLESGWDKTNLAFVNNFGQIGYVTHDEDGLTNYPSMDHISGSDAMLWHGRHFGADVTFGLFDLWIQNPQDLAQLTRFIPWCPIDYDPVPPPILQNLRFANRIVAMSKFGQKKLQEAGFSSTYIPHHVDTKIFYPLSKEERMQRRVAAGIDPNAFIFGMVAMNKDMLTRKSFGQVIDAFAEFVKKHPNSFLYIHTNPDMANAYPIKTHAMQKGVLQRIIFPDQYKREYLCTKQDMNYIYNTFDVYLMPSSTEGFGITAIEAQACGIPVITNNYTSMPELIIPEVTGYLTEVGCQHFIQVGSYMKYPSIESLYKQMIRMKGMKLDLMGEKARKHIEKTYALDKVWSEKWIPYLNNLEKEMYPDSLTTPQLSA